MKNLITLAAIILTTTAAMATTPRENKIITIEPAVAKEIVATNTNTNNTIARVYKNKNSRITKALKFASKKTKAKMA